MANIVVNPSFESGVLTPWWKWASTGGPTGALEVTTDAYAGTYAGRLYCTAWVAGSLIAGQTLDNQPSFAYDLPVRLRLFYKSTASCRFTILGQEFPPTGGGIIRYTAQSPVMPATSVWTEVIVEGPAIPGNLAINDVALHFAIQGVGEVKFDEVIFELVMPPPPPTQVDVTYRSTPLMVAAIVNGFTLQPNQSVKWNVGDPLVITVPPEVVI